VDHRAHGVDPRMVGEGFQAMAQDRATGKMPVIRVKVAGLGDGEMLKVLQDVAGTI